MNIKIHNHTHKKSRNINWANKKHTDDRKTTFNTNC